MARRPRSDSNTSAVDVMVEVAKGDPEIPKHVKLRECDIPFWNGILRARVKVDWVDYDLVVAAQLARTQADIEREQATLYSEGSVIDNSRGTPIPNPRVAVLEALARREMALLRTLRMAGAVVGDVRDQAAKLRAQRTAAEARDAVSAEEDDLLPT